MHAALLVKVDSRKKRLEQEARQILEGFDLDVKQAEIPLLAALIKQRSRVFVCRMPSMIVAVPICGALGAGRPIVRPLSRSVNACQQQRIAPSVLDQETAHFWRRSPIRQIF